MRSIDELWVKYSNGHFGFSVQKRIYQSLGLKREYDEQVWQNFGERVGWRSRRSLILWLDYEDITFNNKAPEGHLPVCGGVFWFGVLAQHLWWRRGGIRGIFGSLVCLLVGFSI